jgi:hypothetical protein
MHPGPLPINNGEGRTYSISIMIHYNKYMRHIYTYKRSDYMFIYTNNQLRTRNPTTGRARPRTTGYYNRLRFFSPDNYSDRNHTGKPEGFFFLSAITTLREAKLAALAIRCNEKLLAKAMRSIAGGGERGMTRFKRATGSSRASFATADRSARRASQRPTHPPFLRLLCTNIKSVTILHVKGEDGSDPHLSMISRSGPPRTTAPGCAPNS